MTGVIKDNEDKSAYASKSERYGKITLYTYVDCVASEEVDMNPFPVRKKQMAKKDAHRDLQKKENIISSCRYP